MIYSTCSLYTVYAFLRCFSMNCISRHHGSLAASDSSNSLLATRLALLRSDWLLTKRSRRRIQTRSRVVASNSACQLFQSIFRLNRCVGADRRMHERTANQRVKKAESCVRAKHEVTIFASLAAALKPVFLA